MSDDFLSSEYARRFLEHMSTYIDSGIHALVVVGQYYRGASVFRYSIREHADSQSKSFDMSPPEGWRAARKELKGYRENQIANGEPPANDCRLEVLSDGTLQGYFRHDPELEERVRKELIEESRAWDEKERKKREEQKLGHSEQRSRLSSERLASFNHELDAIFNTMQREPDKLEHCLNYLYQSAVAAAPKGWEKVELVVEAQGEHNTRMDQWVKTTGGSDFYSLPLLQPMQAMDVVEHYRQGMGRPNEDVTFEITKRRIEPRWAGE